MGDMPIYVGYHSADVWANRRQFLLVSYSRIDDDDACSQSSCALKYPILGQLLIIFFACRTGMVFLF